MAKFISRLHYITQETPGMSLSDLVEQACLGGVNWVQFRVKNKTKEASKSLAQEVQQICKKLGATFIINDDVALAKELGADGVHLGKTDMPVEEARQILGSGAIIGATANTAADLLAIRKTSADYIGLGPYRFTTTKENLSPLLGGEGMKAALQEAGPLSIPVIAIGGILPEDVAALASVGVYGIAVSGAISRSQHPLRAARQFSNQLTLFSTLLQ
jgi:thiamine-phosphate pyrophosphorylase